MIFEDLPWKAFYDEDVAETHSLLQNMRSAPHVRRTQNMNEWLMDRSIPGGSEQSRGLVTSIEVSPMVLTKMNLDEMLMQNEQGRNEKAIAVGAKENGETLGAFVEELCGKIKYFHEVFLGGKDRLERNCPLVMLPGESLNHYHYLGTKNCQVSMCVSGKPSIV